MKWKKVISVMLAAACVAGLAACGSSDSSSEGGDSTRILLLWQQMRNFRLMNIMKDRTS